MSLAPHNLPTAGKISIIATLFGVVVFSVMFLFNLGVEEVKMAAAQQQATTSITVLNTPPAWTIDAQEQVGSSTSTPTNSGKQVRWVATATDSNAAPYFLLICSTSATPTANAASGYNNLGTAPPACGIGATKWAVSPAATSGLQAIAATTTLEAWSESNNWFAWICDDDPVNPRCNASYKQGTGTTSSPFIVNHRPAFSAYSDSSPKLPGELVTFYSTSSDADVVGGNDTVRLFVCSTNSFNATTTSCTATTIASSSLAASNPSGAYTITIPTRDQNYAAYGFIVDNHGHTASGGSQGTDAVLTVSNATPYVNSGDITLNGGSTMVLTQAAGQTTGFTLQFAASDNNSCQNASAGDEITGYQIAISRTNVATSSCDQSSEYLPTSCYTSTLATSTWNLSCTASSTSCTGPTDMNMIYDCTFPLWYVADPTDGGATNTPQFATNWSASAAPIDDNSAAGVLKRGTIGQELQSFLAVALDTLMIPYGSLEAGDMTDPLAASTTLRATGNVGIDELLTGESMCTTYTSSVTCPNSASSTINADNQVFATSTVSYANATSAGNILSSTTQKELEINVNKPTSTSTQPTGVTYWGIKVPSSITLAGSYTGENTFYGKVAETSNW